MNALLLHTAYRLPLSAICRTLHVTSYVLCFLLSIFCFPLSASAQRLEVHAIKDLSTNEIANKAWGVGGAVDLDQWVKKTIFRIHFDWAIHRKEDNILNHNYQRLSSGISALYSIKIMEKLTFRCGIELNYSHIRHSYVYEFYEIDSVRRKAMTWLQTANFIGIGAHVALHYELSSRFNIVFNFVPVYLIPINAKSYITTMESEYKKGFWMFPIQLGLSYRLFKPD